MFDFAFVFVLSYSRLFVSSLTFSSSSTTFAATSWSCASVAIGEHLEASFYFTAPGPAILCYRFSFNETRTRSPYMLMPGIKAAVIRFDFVLPRVGDHASVAPDPTTRSRIGSEGDEGGGREIRAPALLDLR